MTDWRPISEAPKDGTCILSCRKTHRQILRWKRRVRVVWWQGHSWRGEVGGYMLTDDDIEGWMPLPDPPA